MQKPSVETLILWLGAAITALAILPVFIVELPAMNDYPNHLARMYLLTSVGTPEQNPYYFVYLPNLYPNLAMDILVPILSHFTTVPYATKAFLVLSQILVVGGAVALELAIKGRHEWASFAAAALLYSLPFAWGFINFEFGVGLALCGIACWFALENQSPVKRLAVHTLFCASIFLCHLVAFGLYVAALFFAEFPEILRRKGNWGKQVKTLLVLVSPAAIILGYFILRSANTGEGATEWSARTKLVSLLHATSGSSPYLSVGGLTAIVVMTIFLLNRRSFMISPQGKWIFIGFTALILALPSRLFGGDFLEVRILIGALLILPAFVSIPKTNQAFHMLPLALLGLIALVNAGHTANLWLSYAPQYAALQNSFRRIARESFVLVGYTNADNAPFDRMEIPIMTATALAAHYSNAFVSTLFTIPGQQPLHVCPDLSRFDLGSAGRASDYMPAPLTALQTVANGTSGPATPMHIRDWVHDFDYLYLLGPPQPNPIPTRLIEVTANQSFTLYQIAKGSVSEDPYVRVKTIRDNASCNPGRR